MYLFIINNYLNLESRNKIKKKIIILIVIIIDKRMLTDPPYRYI